MFIRKDLVHLIFFCILVALKCILSDKERFHEKCRFIPNDKELSTLAQQTFSFYSLRALEQSIGIQLSHLPISLKILLENLLRREDGRIVRKEDIEGLARWNSKAKPDKEIAFMPARVLLQDFTGVPCIVDLAVMRDAMIKMGGDPNKINPSAAGGSRHRSFGTGG